jgi:hypothetical protein
VSNTELIGNAVTLARDAFIEDGRRIILSSRDETSKMNESGCIGGSVSASSLRSGVGRTGLNTAHRF